MRRKNIIALLAVTMVMAFSACGKTEEDLGTNASMQEEMTLNSEQISKETESEQSESVSDEMETETTQQLEIDGMQIYGDILDHLYEVMTNGDENYEAQDGENGILEVLLWMDSRDALDSVGYTIQDISGDGIPELLLGAVKDTDGDKAWGSNIYAVYTCVDGAPSLSFEGWARSSYQYIGDGAFYYYGSGGAMYSIFGTYTISEDGTALDCNDYYFTYEKDESLEEIGFYHNTSGEWDKSVSEELDITADEFWKIEEGLENQVDKIEMTPFSQYTAE